jgi:anti-anti-sigma factor
MTTTITPSASDFMCGNPTFECGGAQIRAQCRHLATVVTISGEIDAINIVRVNEYTRRFILAEKPVILDLSGVDSFGAQAVSLLYLLDEACRTAAVEWALIASYAVIQVLRVGNEEDMFPTADSMPEALHHFADVTLRRRQLLLSLLTKTAQQTSVNHVQF